MSHRTIKLCLELRVDEKVFSIYEVEKIVNNLGGDISHSMIVKDLRKYRIVPSKNGVDPAKHGVSSESLFYGKSAVWAYLKSLDAKKEIDLKRRGIDSFVDILDLRYHKMNLPQM
jgi:hypothetical protein